MAAADDARRSKQSILYGLSVLRNMRAFDSSLHAQPKVGRRRKVARARRWSELCEATISEMFGL